MLVGCFKFYLKKKLKLVQINSSQRCLFCSSGWDGLKADLSSMEWNPAQLLHQVLLHGLCSSVSYWPSISSDGSALGWLRLNQQQKQKSEVYFPAVDNFLLTLSADRKWQIPRLLPGVLWDPQMPPALRLQGWHQTWWVWSCSRGVSCPGTRSTQILPFLCHTRTRRRPWKMKLPAWKQQGKAPEDLSGKLKTGNV